MANAIKRAARSQRSHRRDKNFRQFIWNAHRTAEERAKVNFGHILAEEMKKQRDNKDNTALTDVTYSDIEDEKKENE